MRKSSDSHRYESPDGLYSGGGYLGKNVILALLYSIVFLAHAATAFAAEYSVDLGLTDKTIKDPEYYPEVSEKERILVKFKGVDRSYFVYAPPKTQKVMPVLVALHGAGRTGASMIDTWRSLAKKYSFIIVAPDGLHNKWSQTAEETDFFRSLVRYELKKRHIKTNAVYLFGHSNGGTEALVVAAQRPRLFTGIVVHAATLPIDPEENRISFSTSLVNVSLLLGDDDHNFSVGSARQTLKWLSSQGIEAKLYILKNHGHWYYEDARKINEAAWSLLNNMPLDAQAEAVGP